MDDLQYFRKDSRHIEVVGVPRIEALLGKPISKPESPRVVVNLNFSYGVLAHSGALWIEQTIEVLQRMGIDFEISKHPADTTEVDLRLVTNKSMYAAIEDASVFISRFSSGILESLCMGTPVVYHNPHRERTSKFHDPKGAFACTFDAESLEIAIMRALILDHNVVREEAGPFLEHHCNVGKGIPSQLAASAIKDLLAEAI